MSGDRTGVGGRPSIGPAFSVRFPSDLLDRVDAAAAAAGLTRASWLRDAAEEHVQVGRAELSGFVLWLLDQEQVGHSEVARVIEKPWAYLDWLAVFRRGGSLADLEDAG